eukprot:522964-Prymnesium_polylepis.1
MGASRTRAATIALRPSRCHIAATSLPSLAATPSRCHALAATPSLPLAVDVGLTLGPSSCARAQCPTTR